MKPAGKRQKGKRLELAVAKLIRQSGLDKECRRMPLSGAFTHLPADIYTSLPVHIECKNREKIRFWEWWEETTSRNTFGNKEPVLAITSNHRPIVFVVRAEHYLNLLKTERDYLEAETEQIEGEHS